MCTRGITRNRLLSGRRRFFLYAVVASFALTPVFAGARDQLTPAVENQQASQSVQQVDRGGQETGSSVESPTLYARSNYAWPWAPTYGTVRPNQLRAQGVLRTLVGTMPIGELQTRLPEP